MRGGFFCNRERKKSTREDAILYSQWLVEAWRLEGLGGAVRFSPRLAAEEGRKYEERIV